MIIRNFSSRKALFQITDAAAFRLRQLLLSHQNKNVIGIKIGLKKRGCSGLSYTMNYTQTKDKFDEEVVKDDVKVIVDSKAVMALVGTEMDYVDDEVRSEFVFNNPNSKGSCGCGESFHI